MGGGSAHLAVAANVPHEHRLIRAARCHRGAVRRELDGVDRIAVALQQHDGRVERGRAVHALLRVGSLCPRDACDGDRAPVVSPRLGLLRHHLKREILRVVIRVDALLARGAGLALPCTASSHRASGSMM